MSSSTRRLLAIACSALHVLSIVRLAISIVLTVRGQDPRDYLADPATSAGAVAALGLVCAWLRRDIRALLTRPSK